MNIASIPLALAYRLLLRGGAWAVAPRIRGKPMQGLIGICSRMVRALGIRVAFVSALAGCSTAVETAAQPTVHGVQYSRKVTLADSLYLARFSQVLSVIHKDSTIIILTAEDPHRFVAFPGITVICQSLGTSPSTDVEVEVGVGPQPIDSAVELVGKLGRVYRVFDDAGIVDGVMHADRLHELDDYPIISSAHVVACPFFQD